MDTNAFALLQLFVLGIVVNGLLMGAFSKADTIQLKPTLPPQCNESRLLSETELCGGGFKQNMTRVQPQHWCNLTHFMREYHDFTQCTEIGAISSDCYWPNPLVEGYIIRIHKLFFSNCTIERVLWVDPPEDTVAALILVPVFLTLAMIGVVVWCSKRSDLLA
ncbi:hypothetical protein NHX12_021111 [Muraenolepis orangiensis]|uniref:Receptor activity-modifying protein 3 n=1 Tax=Muraenolepis orangiensis TaxID=630683 RepID=A0A9Q0IUQ7_9TELE|nr:hypothetical protein NHX12_021111 [Muraenolepis orangiensis]